MAKQSKSGSVKGGKHTKPNRYRRKNTRPKAPKPQPRYELRDDPYILWRVSDAS